MPRGKIFSNQNLIAKKTLVLRKQPPTSQLLSVEFVIERLLILVRFPDWRCIVVSLGKTFNVISRFGQAV